MFILLLWCGYKMAIGRAVEHGLLYRVEFSLRGCPGGLPNLWNGRLIGRDHDAVVCRLGTDEPESGEGTAVGEEAAP